MPLAMSIDVPSRQLLVRCSLPPFGARPVELWAALEATGQLQSKLNVLSGNDSS